MNFSRRVKRLGIASGLALGTLGVLTAGLPYGPLDFLQIAAGQVYSSPSPSAPASTGSSSGSTPAAGPATVLAPGSTTAQIVAAFTGTAPANVTATLSAAGGGVIIAGNVGIVIPAGAFGALAGNVTVTVTANPSSLANINAGGPSQFSPNGTILDINITDANGIHKTTFAGAITLVTKPNPADLTMAGGNINNLTLGYVIDADSPPIENTNNEPINTLVIEPPSSITVDPVGGTVSGNLNALGSVIGVVTNPVGYVQTLNPNATEYSSFDPSTSQQFAKQPQFTYLQVTEPQVGNRLLVLDPVTNNYAYVNASDVAPSGPPPAKSSAAVVRGVIAPSAGSSSAPAASPAPSPGIVHDLFQGL